MEIDRPTGADYARADAQAAKQGVEIAAKKRQTLEEQIIVLQGQVSFLAGMVCNMNRSLARPAPEDMKMLERIRDYVKE